MVVAWKGDNGVSVGAVCIGWAGSLFAGVEGNEAGVREGAGFEVGLGAVLAEGAVQDADWEGLGYLLGGWGWYKHGDKNNY